MLTRIPRAMLMTIAMLPVAVLLSVVPSSPAAAAACSSGTGVTVVVGSNLRCVGGGGRSGGSALAATHSVTRVQRQPGFVCQIDGYPSSSCVNTPPSNAYWGVFWSDGKSGRWSYASVGVDSLSIPAGGWVGFAFQTSSSRTLPGATPYVKPPPRKPAAAAGPGATKQPASPGQSSTPTATAKPTAGPSATASTGAPGPQATGDSSVEPVKSASQTTQRGSGTAGWIAAVLAVSLLLGMWTLLWRRRTGAGSR